MEWKIDDSKPIYIQLIEQMQLRIIAGIYPIGEKLPSVREMAAEAEVNPNTVQRALSSLEQTGLIYTRRAVGRFVTEDTDLIEEVKTDFARNQVSNFFYNMNRIGFTNEESIKIAEKINRENKS